MSRDFFKNYVKNLPNNFSSRENENTRLFENINKALKFLNKKLIEPGTRLLDLGSGNGSFYEYCLSKKIICDKLDGAFDNINFEDSKLNLKQDTYDFVYINSVIEHLNDPKNILIEIKKVLKVGGVLIIITPNFKYAYKNFYDDPTHLRAYSHVSIYKLLQIFEFKNIEILPFLINKPNFFWKVPFKFFLAGMIPFKNHTYKKLPIPNFLRGNSTAMMVFCEK